MTETVAECEFEISVDELWDLLGDFGNMSKWSGRPPESCVADGAGIGSLRTITLQDGSKIVDRLEEETEYSYTYSIVSSPLPFQNYRATMSVEPLGRLGSKLKWRGVFEPKGISDKEAIEFAQGMYSLGISMMKKTIAARAAT